MKGLPSDAFFSKTGANKQPRGTLRQVGSHREDGSTYYFVSWMDNKPVHMLSTIPTLQTTCMRRVKVDVNGIEVWQVQEFWQPTLVRLYNKTMGGTDADDQMLSYYRPRVKTVSYVPRLFTHLMQTSLVNAYILWIAKKNLNKNQNRYLDFLNAVIEQWLEPWHNRLANGQAVLLNIGRKRSRVQWNADQRRLHGSHMPIIVQDPRIENRGENFAPTSRNLRRGHCMICLDHSNIKCQQCDVYLCCKRTTLQIQIGDFNCWQKFHTMPNFMIGEEDYI